MVNVDTLSDLLILATITGYPEPDVEVRHEGVLIDQALDSRFEFTFDDQSGRLTIRIGNILRGDGGQYEITAFNGINSDSVSFSVFAIGKRTPYPYVLRCCMSHVSGSSMPWDAACHMCQVAACHGMLHVTCVR